jgi:hypothetical protein
MRTEKEQPHVWQAECTTNHGHGAPDLEAVARTAVERAVSRLRLVVGSSWDVDPWVDLTRRPSLVYHPRQG